MERWCCMRRFGLRFGKQVLKPRQLHHYTNLSCVERIVLEDGN